MPCKAFGGGKGLLPPTKNEAGKPHKIRLFQPLNVHAAVLPYRKTVFTEKIQIIFATHLQNE